MRKSLVYCLLLLVGALNLSPVSLTPVLPRVNGGLVGVVCISDPTSTSCPAAPIPLSGPAGTNLEVAVNIQGSDTLNGFDIFVRADPTIVHPVNVNLTGSVLGTNILVVAQCIESSGSGCSAQQTGPGIVRLAAVALGFATVSPTTGRLFTITYNIIQNSSGITVDYQTGCTGTSVPPNFCVSVVYGGAIVPETIQTSSTSGQGDFSISAGPSALSVLRGSFILSSITLSSVAGFFGGISLSTTVSPIARNGLLVTLADNSVVLQIGTSTLVILEVDAFGKTPPVTYTVTVTATSGLKSHSAVITVKVVPR